MLSAFKAMSDTRVISIQIFLFYFPRFISSSYCSFFLVQIFCDVIRGAFDISSNAGNGHKAQDGGPGADGLDNTEAVISIFFGNV